MDKENTWAELPKCTCAHCQQNPNSPIAGQHRSIDRLVALADERSRRLLVGFLAQQHGRGGISLMSRITGLDRNTIARGLRELQSEQPLAHDRIRRRGGGRKRVEITVPGS